MEILKDVKNELLKRREVKVIVNADSNPGIAEAAKIIANKFKSPEENVAVKTLKSKFGRDTFLIDAFVYDRLEDKGEMEIKPKPGKTAA